MSDSFSTAMRHRWLLPTLLNNDDLYWGRWKYWYDFVLTGILPEDPIPPIEFEKTPDPLALKMFERSLCAISASDEWKPAHFNYLVDWLLWSFGYGDPTPPTEPVSGAAERLRDTFNLPLWQQHPYDYLGEFLAEQEYVTDLGFSLVTMPTAEMMAEETTAEAEQEVGTEELKVTLFASESMGTGRHLLLASNKTLWLAGTDILPIFGKIVILNGYVMAPWLAKGIPWIDQRYRITAASTFTLNDPIRLDEPTIPLRDPICAHYTPVFTFQDRPKILDKPGPPLANYFVIQQMMNRQAALMASDQAQECAAALQSAIKVGVHSVIGDRIESGRIPTPQEVEWALNYGPTFRDNFMVLFQVGNLDGPEVLELCNALAIIEISGNSMEDALYEWLLPDDRLDSLGNQDIVIHDNTPTLKEFVFRDSFRERPSRRLDQKYITG